MPRLHTALLVVARLQSELNRIFGEAIEAAKQDLAGADWQPAVDVVETPRSLVVLAEVPGVRAADLQVEVRGSVVTIAGTKGNHLQRAGQARFQCVESGRGRFARQVRLLHPVDSSRGRATLAQGLLTVDFPKVEDKRQQGRRLAVEEAEDPGDD